MPILPPPTLAIAMTIRLALVELEFAKMALLVVNLADTRSSLASEIVMQLFILPSISLGSGMVICSPTAMKIRIASLTRRGSRDISIPPYTLMARGL